MSIKALKQAHSVTGHLSFSIGHDLQSQMKNLTIIIALNITPLKGQ
jgi:hypothetical protein